jgi:hypothetical protein
MNILDPQQQAALNDPMLGLTGDKPTNVRDQVTPSKEYQTALQGAGIIGAFGHASKGRWMGGIMSGLGMGGAGMADYVLNPAANKAQTAVDTAWLGHARNRDRLEQPFSFRGKGAKMSGPADLLNLLGRDLATQGIRGLSSAIAHGGGGRGKLRYYLFRRPNWDLARDLDPKRTLKRDVDFWTRGHVDARSKKDITTDLVHDVQDKLVRERTGFERPWGSFKEMADSPLGLGFLLNSNNPLNRGTGPLVNPLLKRIGHPGKDAFTRRTNFMRDLETKGLAGALENPRARAELAATATPALASAAVLGTAGAGAAAVGNLVEGISKQSERGQTLIRKKLSSYQVHLTGLVLEAAHARSAIDRGAGVLVPKRVPGEKVSSKVVISSPLEKRANFNAVLRESVGMTPYEVPGMGGGGLFSEAWKNRPAAVGGKPKWMHTAAGLKDLLMRDELVVNASGVPVGRNRTFLPGMPGKFLRIPLALGGLMALNAGVQSWQDKRHAEGADARFESALTSLRNDEMFRDSHLDMIDPNSEAGKLTIPKVREGFDVLDRYAPDVSSDPQLASQFVESLVAGVDTEGVAMSPAEYSQHVEQALSLQNAIDKRKDKTIFGNLSGMVTDLIDPE